MAVDLTLASVMHGNIIQGIFRPVLFSPGRAVYLPVKARLASIDNRNFSGKERDVKQGAWRTSQAQGPVVSVAPDEVVPERGPYVRVSPSVFCSHLEDKK